MDTNLRYSHLARDAKKGLVIEGSRHRVRHLAAEHREYGWSAEELQENHPDLPMAAIYSALAYYYDHREEVDAEIDEQADTVAAQLSKSPHNLRERLEKRQGR